MKPLSIKSSLITLALILAGLCVLQITQAAPLTKTPRHLSAGDVSTLRSQLTSTDTSIVIEPMEKWINGAENEQCFDTGSGFVLIEDSLGRQEWASFGTKSCSASFVTTLSDVRRGLNPSSPSFASGVGITFDAGAEIRVIDWPVIYNNSLYIDHINDLSGSGAIRCISTSQPCIINGSYSQSEIDAFTWAPDSSIIYNETNGLFYGRGAGVWEILATGSGTALATEITSGKSELATVSDHITRNMTGTSLAPLVVQSKNLETHNRTYNPAYLSCGSGATRNYLTYVGVTNGSFAAFINGTKYPVTGVDFTGITSMTGIALVIQEKLEDATSASGTVTWTANGTSTGFTISSWNTTSGSAITYFTKNVGTNTGTSIVGGTATPYMLCNSGSGSQVFNAVKNGEPDYGKLPILNESGSVNSLVNTSPFDKSPLSFVPTGSMFMWMTNTAPNGYLLAYGQCVSRQTYRDLFNVFGTTFNSTCTHQEFGIPDLRGRMALGQDDMGGSSANRVTASQADTIGGSSGASLYNLDHKHTPVAADIGLVEIADSGGGTFVIGTAVSSFFKNTTGQAVGVTATGSSVLSAKPIMPPYITTNYIIKY